MAAMKTISRTALAAFSPTENFIAAGAVAGSLDSSFSSSTCIEVFKLDFASDGIELPLVGSCSTAESVARLSWGSAGIGTEAYPYGLLAGALADASIDVWNPATLVSSDANDAENAALLMKLERSQQSVRGLEFNPLQSNLLASGGSDGTVNIWDFANATAPQHFPPLQSSGAEGEISYLSWNRKLSHILATSLYTGVCAVWDLRKQKNVLRFGSSFSDPFGKKRYSALQWNPEDPTCLIVAVEDDNAPSLQMWDLRKSVAPTNELSGHSKGILSLAWCPSDSSMLLSCAKDNRTLCWHVTGDKGEVISELPSSNAWNFDVQWSSRTPGVLSTSSYDGKISIYNVESCHRTTENQFGRVSVAFKAPKWLKRPVGTSFAFGGQLVSFFQKEKQNLSEVRVETIKLEEDLLKRSTDFEAAIAADDRKTLLKSFCDRKASEAEADQEREIWAFLKVMFDDDTGRKVLLKELGFEVPEVDALSEEFEEKAMITEGNPPETASQIADFQLIDNGEEFFENLQDIKDPEPVPTEINGKEEPSEEDHEFEEEAVESNREMEEKIEQALVVGNFKGAVDYCISVNKMADALMIAYTGGPALWERTSKEYVKKNRRPYLQVMSAIASHDLKGLVESRPLTAWKETLALLGTYSRVDEWSLLVDALGSRLDAAGDKQAATLCFICAGNVEKTVEVLSRALDANYGKDAVISLQDLVEKAIILSVATEQQQSVPALARVVERYAELLASQGLLESAMAYISVLPGDLPSSLAILQDRIYRSGQTTTSPSVPSYTLPQEQPIYTQQPQQQQQQQSFASQHPTYTSQQGTFVPQQPTFAPQQSSFTPQQPTFTPQQSTFVPQQQSPLTQQQPPFTHPTFTPQPPVTQQLSSFTQQQPSLTLNQQQPPFVPTPPAFASQQPPPYMQPQSPYSRSQQPSPFQPYANAPSYPAADQPPANPPFKQFIPSTTNPPVRGFFPSTPPPIAGMNQFQTQARQHPVAPPPQVVANPQPQPLISHLTSQIDNSYAPRPQTPLTIQNVDTSKVRDDLRPIVTTLRKLYTETSRGHETNPAKKREMDDNSRKLATLFVKLNSGDVSPNVASKLQHLCQSTETGDFPTALQIINDLTSKEWEECGQWLVALRRLVKARQSML